MLAPDGMLIVEDIDYAGSVSGDPPNQAFDRHAELYIAAALKRGADPLIGRRLARACLKEPALPMSTHHWCSRSATAARSSR